MTGPAIELKEGSFRRADVQLRYSAWVPERAAAVLLIVHGLADHSRRYDHVGRALAAHGISTWAFDQRGHGRSGGRRGHADRFSQLLQDLGAFRAHVARHTDPGAPLFLLGHSLGGLVTLRYLQETPGAVVGAIVVSPWLATAMRLPRWKVGLAAVLERIAPALPVPAEIPAEYLSHDPAVVRSYRDDPLVHDRITPRLFAEVAAAMDHAGRHANRIGIPLLFLLAGEDRIVDTERSRAVAASIDGAEVHVLDGLYHEVLNEPGAAIQIDSIADWIRARAGGGADGVTH